MKFYPRDKFELFDKFWKALEEALENRTILLPREVFLETKTREEIAEFLKKYPQAIIDNECIYEKMSTVLKDYPDIALKQRGNKPSKNKYHADPHIISLALCVKESLLSFIEEKTNVIIVSEEKKDPNKIPWIASKYGIKCITLLDMMQELGVK